MEKFLEYLHEAERIVQTADHIMYVTFPLIKDKRLLLKIISEIKIAIANCINAILQYEYINKRIALYKDPRLNLKTFEEKCAQKYGIENEEIKLISELFRIVEKYKQSQMQFIKDNKIVILSENLNTHVITIEKIKKLLDLSKDILKKTKSSFLR
jgi:hypothetical protein